MERSEKILKDFTDEVTTQQTKYAREFANPQNEIQRLKNAVYRLSYENKTITENLLKVQKDLRTSEMDKHLQQQTYCKSRKRLLSTIVSLRKESINRNTEYIKKIVHLEMELSRFQKIFDDDYIVPVSDSGPSDEGVPEQSHLTPEKPTQELTQKPTPEKPKSKRKLFVFPTDTSVRKSARNVHKK